jgi:predicted secreted protein
MPTTGIINGTQFGVYVNDGSWKLIGFSTSCNISISQETRSTTTQATGLWNTRTIGSKDWEVSCDSLISMEDVAAKKQWYQIFESYLDESNAAGYIPTFQLRFMTDGNTGDKFLYGDAILSSLSIDAPQEQSSTMSVTFIAAGKLNLGTQ